MSQQGGEKAEVKKAEQGEERTGRTLSSAKSESQQSKAAQTQTKNGQGSVPKAKLQAQKPTQTSTAARAVAQQKKSAVQTSGRSTESRTKKEGASTQARITQAAKATHGSPAKPQKAQASQASGKPAAKQSKNDPKAKLAVAQKIDIDQSDATSVNMKPIKVKEARRVGEPRLAASASSEAIPRVSARQRSQGAAGQTQTTVSGRIKGKSSDAAPTRVVRANEPASQFEESADFKAAVNPNNLGKAKVPRARRMQLSLTRVEPWSVAKVSFLLAIAGGIIQVIAACLLWVLLNTIGLFDNITQMVSKTGLDAGGLDLSSVLSLGTVISSVTIFSIFEIVLVVVLATIGAFLYNVVGSLVGGIHVTLGDD